jgi:3-oxoacyl-[acyl-carrier-protein] synthase I
LTNKDVYIKKGELICAIGNNLAAATSSLKNCLSGVVSLNSEFPDFKEFPLGYIDSIKGKGRFETLYNKLIASIKDAEIKILKSKETLIILSSTKGDIEALPKNPFGNLSKRLIKDLELENQPIIISNACISGVLAINLGADLIKNGRYSNVIVAGIDVLSEFVISGFNAFFALSRNNCKPFDKSRDGINLGESACYVVLSDTIDSTFNAKYLGGSSSNDANHISGPSRTGEGLFRTVKKTLNEANKRPEDVDYISAHGTSTLYNDEMESIAFDRLGMNFIPINSFKGYIGHALGAAGIAETIMAMLSMENNKLYASLGYNEIGVSRSINVIEETHDQSINLILKTGSGFGGGNASLLIEKIKD